MIIFLKQVDTPRKFQKVIEDYVEEMTGYGPIQVGVDSLPKGQLHFLNQSAVVSVMAGHLLVEHWSSDDPISTSGFLKLALAFRTQMELYELQFQEQQQRWQLQQKQQHSFLKRRENL